MKKIKALISLMNVLGLTKDAQSLEVSQLMAIMTHLTTIGALLITKVKDGKLVEAENLADDLTQAIKKAFENDKDSTTAKKA